MSDLSIERKALGSLAQLGSGGTAKVYRCADLTLPGMRPIVYKEYKKATIEHAGPALLPGLLDLVKFRADLDPTKQSQWDAKTVWPLRVVVDGGSAVGILMEIIPDEYFVTMRQRSGATRARPAELDLLQGADADAAELGLATVSIGSRLRICAQIVSTYALMHQRGIIAGDLSARNAVFRHGREGIRVLLVDCDSARVRGRRSAFGDQPHTPGWEPPESMQAARELKIVRRDPNATPGRADKLRSRTMTQSIETDVYKVGLLVTRILDHGRHRSRNRNPEHAVSIVARETSRDLARMLERALDPLPANRPQLIEWYNVWRGRRPDRPIPSMSEMEIPEASVTAPSPVPGAPLTRAASPPETQPATRGAWTLVPGVGWTRMTQPEATGS